MKAWLLEPPAFNERKATQAAAYFLKLNAGRRMNYMLLIKLLYILDRRALRKWGRPVTGDTYFSMKYGPVLSGVLELINEMPDPGNVSYWATYISEPSGYSVRLKKDPGDDELSEAEECVINTVFGKYGHYDRFKLAELLHRILPEWKPVKSGRSPITYAQILKAIGRSPREVAAIEKELDSLALVRSRFSSSGDR